MKSKFALLVLLPVFLLVLLNPDAGDFRGYINAREHLPMNHVQYGRTANYLLWSRYEYHYSYGGYEKHGCYTGCLKNFW